MGLIESALSPWIRDPSKIVSSYDEWKWIQTKKRDNDGNIKEAYYEMAYHVSTGEMYYKDPVAAISAKAFLILFVNPFHVVFRMAYHLVKIPFDVVSVCIQATKELFESFGEKTIIDAFYDSYRGKVADAAQTIGNNVKEIFRSIWYGAGVEIAAFFAWTTDPFKARSVISQIEQDWNHGASYGTDFRIKYSEQYDNISYESEPNSPSSFFLALCCQKRGNINDTVNGMPKYIVLQEFNSYNELAELDTQCEPCLPGYPLIPKTIYLKC